MTSHDPILGTHTFGEEFLDIAVGQSVAQVPAHSQQDHIGREPVSGERSGLGSAATIHLHKLAASHPIRQRNGAGSSAFAANVCHVNRCVRLLTRCLAPGQQYRALTRTAQSKTMIARPVILPFSRSLTASLIWSIEYLVVTNESRSR